MAILRGGELSVSILIEKMNVQLERASKSKIILKNDYT